MLRGRGLFGNSGKRALEGLEDEIRHHLEHEIELNIARGMSPDEARRQALIRFGNVTLVEEDTRAVWAWRWVDGAWQDLRVGARILINAPAVSATAATLIALVVGINTMIFSVVNTLVTRPAPGIERTDLVRIAAANRPGIPYFSYPDYLDYRAQSTTLQSLTAFTNGRITLASDRGSYAVWAAAVEANYFDTIGVRPVLGRAFTGGEGRTVDASEMPAILSHRAWQEYFGGGADVIGRQISVNGQPAIVIGVAPPSFHGAMLTERADVWLPLLGFWRMLDPIALRRWMTDRSESPIDMIGRLAPDASVSAVQSELSTIQRRLESAYPRVNGASIEVVRYTATAGGVIPAAAPRFLAVFSIVTLLTVVVVSANVANLMLARGAARQRETAVRLSIGASRSRIVRLLLAEGFSISVVAWVAAIVMAVWASRVLPSLMPDTPFAESGLDFTPSWRVLAYAMALAGLGTVVFTLAPAIRAWRQDPLPWLKAGEHSVAHGRSRLSNALVVVQLAFSVLLLTSAGLATRSASMMTVDLGFDTNDLLVATVRTSGSTMSRQVNIALVDRIHDRLSHLPQVRSVSYRRPFFGPQRVQAGTQPQVVTMHVVGPDYLRTLGVPLIAGRSLIAADRDRVNGVAMINENLANGLWPAQPAVGHVMTFGAGQQSVEVVGVVRNAYVTGFNPERPDAHPSFVFVAEQPSLTSGDRDDSPFPGDVTFYLRHERAALEAVSAAIAPALREIDPRVAIVTMRTMEAQLDGVTLTARLIARLLAIFAIVSLVIAAIGQYAVVAFNMRRRIREFGVRIALGASTSQVLSSVLGEGVWLTSAGLLCGLVLSLGAALAGRGLLFGVTPTDAQTYIGVFALLASVALIACVLPARAATRVDPVRALRQE